VPPLYRVKLGNQEFYFEKESQLEELLVRERFDQLDVRDRAEAQVKLTEARWKRFTSALAEFEGWSARLRADYGHHAADLVIAHARQEQRGRADVLRAAQRRARPREGGRDPALALQGPRRDERGAALGDDDGPRRAAAHPRRRRGRARRRPALLDAHGRPGGA